MPRQDPDATPKSMPQEPIPRDKVIDRHLQSLFDNYGLATELPLDRFSDFNIEYPSDAKLVSPMSEYSSRNSFDDSERSVKHTYQLRDKMPHKKRRFA